MLCSGIVIVYILRVNMSVAVQAIKDELNWSEVEKGYVLSSFYMGYAVGQIPSAMFAQKYGAKTLFGLSVLIPSILSLFVPVACRTSFGMALFIRALLGLCESACFPALFHFLPMWVPKAEKTLLVGVAYSGMYIGIMIAYSVSGYMLESSIIIGGNDVGGWPFIFYFFGCVGIAWYPYWWYMAFESPAVHPLMEAWEKALIADQGPIDSEKEKILDVQQNPLFSDTGTTHMTKLTESLVDNAVESGGLLTREKDEDTGGKVDPFDHTPWRQFFTHAATLTLLFNHFTHGWIGFLLLSELPSYMTQELDFDIKAAGILLIAPYLALFASTMFFGEAFRNLQGHHGWKTRTVRQVAEFTAFGVAALILAFCGFIKDKWAVYTLLITTQLFLGAQVSGIGCAYLDIAPVYSGIYTTTGNTLGAVAGILGPIAVGYLTEALPGSWGWRTTFFADRRTCSCSSWLVGTVPDIYDHPGSQQSCSESQKDL